MLLWDLVPYEGFCELETVLWTLVETPLTQNKADTTNNICA